MDPFASFATDHYQRHNSRRLEHLATLGLDLAGKNVLEVGVGIGDHPSFFLDRGWCVTALEGRPENLQVLKSCFPSLETLRLDLDDDETDELGRLEIVYAGWRRRRRSQSVGAGARLPADATLGDRGAAQPVSACFCVPVTQPWHEEFPLDWSLPALSGRLTRAIFVASRRPIENPLLVNELPDRQTHAG